MREKRLPSGSTSFFLLLCFDLILFENVFAFFDNW